MSPASLAPAMESFEVLVDRYKDRVFRLAVSIVGPGYAAEAEEVAQEAFLRAYRSLDHFRGESAFGSWLYRITYNLAIDAKRKARMRYPHVGEEALQNRATALGNPFSELAENRAARRCAPAWKSCRICIARCFISTTGWRKA